MTYATEEERVAARRNSWAQYNRAHRAGRSAHKTHVQKEYVKARRRGRYTLRLCKIMSVTYMTLYLSPRRGYWERTR